jgi:hypothetical protein
VNQLRDAAQAALMARPLQVPSPQGYLLVTRDVLAAREASNASGWKQSKENRALGTVEGQRAVVTAAAPQHRVARLPIDFSHESLLRTKILLKQVHLSDVSSDTVAEWLRRRPAKPLGSARVGSNPIGVVPFAHFNTSECELQNRLTAQHFGIRIQTTDM